MLAIHALWSISDRLLIWAEDSAGPARRAGRRPRLPAHPFAAPTEMLIETLGDTAAKAATGSATLRLPTVTGGPVGSPELVREEPPGSGPSSMAPWLVPTLAYQPDEALAALGELAGRTELILGSTVRHLIELADFAADLVARGRLLPGLVLAEDGPRACWRPVLTGPDAAWARALALALPPAGRAESTDGADQPDPAPAARTVIGALDALVDAAARGALGGVSLGPAQSGRPTAALAWRRALTGRQREFTAAPADVAALRDELAGWQRDAVGGPVRACFRLIEPVEDEPGEDEPGPAGGSDNADAPDAGRSAGGARRPGTAARPGAAGSAGTSGKADTAGKAGELKAAGGAGGGGGAGWQLRFALQAADEPSLMVDAEQVWRSPGALDALARHVEAPQETLLAELGRASRLYPGLTPALQTARPSTLDLDVHGAFEFLAEAVPMLAAAGFGVLLPSWWTKSARLGVRLTAGSRSAPGTVAGQSQFGLNAIVDYQWDLALGDEQLTEAEIEELTALRAPLVRLRGKWVQVDAKRLAAGLKLLRAEGTGQLSVGELLRIAGAADEAGPAGLPVSGITARGWLADLLTGTAEQRLQPVAAPDGFTGTLRPYQERGLAWLHFLQSLGLGGILADDMGLGKTVQLLALIAGDPVDSGPTLLVCPMSLVGNWQREATKFAPGLGVHVHHGAERPRGKEFAAAVRTADLVVTTYALAARDAKDLAKVSWHRLVVDEAQAIKNAATRQAVAVRALPATHRIAVTGTPVENRLADLWSLMEFANPGLLGNPTAFKQRYAEPVERHGDERAAAGLRKVTQPFVLRRLKTDKSIISDLPTKLEMEVVCNLTAEQAALYGAVVAEMLTRIEQSTGIERRGLVLATMTRLKQICNHPAQFLRDGSRLAGRSGKLARLEEILEEVLAAGEKALLFTQYAEFGALLRGHLSARFGREVLYLHGGVAKADRDAMVARFQAADPATPPIFVLSLKAGGTGLTLTAANHVVHVDRWWNPAVEDQATDRAFRIGQRRAVQVRKFVCAGTLEEKISAMIQEKRGLAERIVGTGEQWLTELSTAELRDLLALDAGAVVE